MRKATGSSGPGYSTWSEKGLVLATEAIERLKGRSTLVSFIHHDGSDRICSSRALVGDPVFQTDVSMPIIHERPPH
ncbi:hypothetical protein C8J36_11420 [Rhizobium sp. PP-F2F-G48]|nr:hypothetical protein C8J36_11420 [Rhizobium sp. PP-F2F-G48]